MLLSGTLHSVGPERKLSTEELMLLNHGAGEYSWEFLGQQGDLTSQTYGKSTLNIHWKVWCWSWSCNTLATWCEEQTHWKDPDAGKDWRQRRRGQWRMRWLDSTTNSVDVNLRTFREIVEDREAWFAAVHGVAKSWTWLSSWTATRRMWPYRF